MIFAVATSDATRPQARPPSSWPANNAFFRFKAIGLINVALALHPEVDVTITLNVARSTDEAERQARGETLTSAEAIYGEDVNENAQPENFFDPEAEIDVDEDEAVEAEEPAETAADEEENS